MGRITYSKNFGGKKVWRIGTQNSFDGENFGRLSINTEGNEEKLVDKSLAN